VKTMKHLFGVVCSILIAAPLFAGQPPPGQTEFVPMNSLPPTEQVQAAPLLVAAYAFVWLALTVYVWSIWSRLGKVEGEMRALQQKVARGAR
jgi:CcmD family protein